MFHSYVSLPEGNLKRLFVFYMGLKGLIGIASPWLVISNMSGSMSPERIINQQGWIAATAHFNGLSQL